MEITPGWAAVTISAIGMIGAGVATWLRTIDSTQEKALNGIKATQITLFTKHDEVSTSLHNYKIHVAENYVNREILKEQLAPISRALDNIQEDLKDEYKRGRNKTL